MALQLNNIGAVDFAGQRQITPVITIEKQLRLQGAKFDTQENAEASFGTIASFFPEDEEFVKSVLHKLPLMELYRLQSYLLGGDRFLESIDDKVGGANV